MSSSLRTLDAADDRHQRRKRMKEDNEPSDHGRQDRQDITGSGATRANEPRSPMQFIRDSPPPKRIRREYEAATSEQQQEVLLSSEQSVINMHLRANHDEAAIEAAPGPISTGVFEDHLSDGRPSSGISMNQVGTTSTKEIAHTDGRGSADPPVDPGKARGNLSGMLCFRLKELEETFLCRRPPWDDVFDRDAIFTIIRDNAERRRRHLLVRTIEHRMDIWGLCQLALSGEIPEENLFKSFRDGECYMLRPTPRSPVPLQWIHISPGAIPDALADMSLANVPYTLRNLNVVMGTAYTLEMEGMREFLEYAIRESRDFGEVYGHGICSATEYSPIIWVADEDRVDVWTNINGNQWPAPTPRATTLEHVRVELLNMGAEYVWVDVLCLRQKGHNEDEPARLEEWKVDVPTIGYIYQAASSSRRCVTYFNGLGLPFATAPDVVASDRHWFNRVWTLQESVSEWLPGGLADTSFVDGHAFFARLSKIILSASPGSGTSLTQDLISRHCTNELDRIVGLAYCSGDCITLPIVKDL
ncbi:uncharacterized protein PHACADRAFT_200229 [Phanerochaete carnosa HHB-10118-sp]|uniref:Heterokaryon incompatibility domain-containing protein n=1 Tax=Phanerochaete carnosa (strain HHB-10118-sp) TaxID=650164 RepID=K5WM92_PHACS|nr:uncharacterized protein PHACADRAFT_200229 [Phanerochaete carnosa HHB-10118-sp]EKM51402.1 hypothetical protein PHACADRAFT_200229 [Phanerochaete carnosa HHB-10118-sp]